MISTGVQLALWLAGAAVLVSLASWLGFRSYRRFAIASRGAVMMALAPGGSATPLDALLDPLEAAHPGQTGLANLLINQDAFAARAVSAAAAGRSLDLMSYIWSTDITGWLLIADLLAAADRGVRVRLLLDDVNVQGFDPAFLALNQHPNVEVRLFNPIRNRGHVIRRTLEMLLGLSRFNRRMHGKMWLADGRVAITGGRNVGDTYFGATAGGKRMSRDADVIVVGPTVAELAAVFDSYWNLGLALPILTLWPKFKMNMRRFRARLQKHCLSADAQAYLTQAVAGRDAATLIAARLRWTDKVEVLADPPEKAYGERPKPWMAESMATVLGRAQQEVQLVTPYFVPGKRGLQVLADLARRGVRVHVVTNALSATDMVLVHGAYRYYRLPLLQAGAQVHEFSPLEDARGKRDVIHTKVFVIDAVQAVVGSLNFDMRSAFMNTELGVRFEQPDLVAELRAMMAEMSAPDQSYAVTVEGRALRWAVQRPGLPAVMAVEPDAPKRLRAVSWVVGHLPIQAYL